MSETSAERKLEKIKQLLTSIEQSIEEARATLKGGELNGKNI